MDDDATTRATPAPASPTKLQGLRDDAKNLLVGGATLGTFSVVTTALLGATCPMCIVVAPVMLGAGAIQHWRASRLARACDAVTEVEHVETLDETPSMK